MDYVFGFVQTACVLIVLSYLLSRAGIFSENKGAQKLHGQRLLFIVAAFVFVALYGNLIRSSLPTESYVDTRMASIVLAGLLFGYFPGALVTGVTILFSVFLGEQTLIADCISMVLAFFVSGLAHKSFEGYDAVLSGVIMGALEICHMLIIVAVVRPLSASTAIIYDISFPLIVINGLAVIGFVLIITDMEERRNLWQKENFSRSEFQVARNLQASLLDTKFDIDPRLDLSAFLTPAMDVGGDLYSFLIDGPYFKFIVGDVSGKGVAASITMSRCETLFQELVLGVDSPAQVLTVMNQRLVKNNDVMMFVTACVGFLDLNSGRLVYANAGHVQPYVVEAGRIVTAPPRPAGKPLGILARGTYEDAETCLPKGSYFLSYTDGVTEAENVNRELFGNHRLEETISNLPQVSAKKIEDTVLAAVRTHAAGAKQSDDIAVFCFGTVTAPIRCDFENTLDDFLAAAEKINQSLNEFDVPQTFKDDAALILEELVVNIICHGYEDGQKGQISIQVWPRSQEIVITDDAKHFDSFEAATPVIELAPKNRPIGGIGIFMTKNRVDKHSYQSVDGLNTLTLHVRKKVSTL